MKTLIIDYEKCVGCDACVQVCSLVHSGIINPKYSRIEIYKLQMGTKNIPIVCAQCNDALCMKICPTNAIYRDDELGRIAIDHYRCIGCKLCFVLCPFGCMYVGGKNENVYKCDLCDGDPMCVKFCQYDAIRYSEPEDLNYNKQIRVAESIGETLGDEERVLRII